MFDIGAFELLILAVITLVVVGPKDLPRLIRTMGQFAGKIKRMSQEFRAGMENLANEADLDEFEELRKLEGINKNMSPEEITEKIMGNREQEGKEKGDD